MPLPISRFTKQSNKNLEKHYNCLEVGNVGLGKVGTVGKFKKV